MSANNQDSARAVIEQLWLRARINAFAHRAASEEAIKSAKRYFTSEIYSILSSILCIILVYIFSTIPTVAQQAGSNSITPIGLILSNRDIEIAKIVFTILSISFTLLGLYFSVMANYLKFEISGAEHRHLLNSYQHIAQRAREVKWPDLPHDDVVALLKDLERDFQLLKSRGLEPSDQHFEIAHAIVSKIRKSEANVAQSFEIGPVEEMAKHTGDPERTALDRPTSTT